MNRQLSPAVAARALDVEARDLAREEFAERPWHTADEAIAQRLARATNQGEARSVGASLRADANALSLRDGFRFGARVAAVQARRHFPPALLGAFWLGWYSI